MIALHGPKIDPGRAIVFVGWLLALCWMLRPPRTYVSPVHVLDYKAAEKPALPSA